MKPSLFVLCVLSAGSAFAQATFGSISGIVTDPAAAVVPNASIVVTNQQTGISKQVSSDQSGSYEATHLNAGAYSLTVQAPGFKKTEYRDIELEALRHLRIDVSLEVGGVASEGTEPLQAVPLTTQPGVHRYPSFSPDGNYVAFTWTGPKQDNQDIYVQQIGAGTPLRLTQDPRNDYNPVWSPDGRWVAFLRLQPDGKSELRLIPPLGGPERHVTEIRVREVFVSAPYLAWCPDSNCLVVTDSPGEGKPVALFVVSRDTGERRQLTYPQAPAAGDAHPAVSADGNWLIFRRNASGIFSGELYRLPLRTGLIPAGEPKRLTPGTLDANYPTWMPGNKEILFSARDSLWRLGVDRENRPTRLPFVGEDGIMPAVSRPQPGQPPRLVYVRSFADLNIWRVETSAPGATASSPAVVSISSTRREGMPQLSPDGRRVAFFQIARGQGESGSQTLMAPTLSRSPRCARLQLAIPTGLPMANWLCSTPMLAARAMSTWSPLRAASPRI